MQIAVPGVAQGRQDNVRFRVSTVGWLLPAIALLSVLFIVPVAYAIFLAFTNLQLLGPHAQTFNFTGAANLTRLVHDAVFWHSLVITAIFVIGSGIVAQSVLGMALALLMQRALPPLRLSIGAIVVLAWVLPEIATAFVWYAAGQAGGVVSLLTGSSSTDYLSTSALLIVCVANAWRGTAFSMLVFSAGLRNVPEEIQEAAQLEGAGYWRRLFAVTLPVMRPTIVTNLLLITLASLSDFTLIFAMTQGGPGNDTAILPVYGYIEAFQFNELGYGTTIALVLVVLGGLFSTLYIRQLRPELDRAK